MKDELHYFTSEGCAAFAYALWLNNGKQGQLRLLLNPHDNEIEHVVYVDKGRNAGSHYDVKGLQMPDDIAARFGLTNDDWGDSYDPEDYWSKHSGNNADIKWAMKIISEYPDIYS